MPVVYIPAALRHLAEERTHIDLPGVTLRQVFAALAEQYPELTARIIEHDDLRADIAVAIDGSILEGGGLVQAVAPDAEIYLVPPIGGGDGRGQPPCSPRSPHS